MIKENIFTYTLNRPYFYGYSKSPLNSSANDYSHADSVIINQKIRDLNYLDSSFRQTVIIDNAPKIFKFYKYTQAGSNPGMYAIDKANNLYYTKQAGMQSKVEVLASHLYKLAKINVPNMAYYETKNGTKGLISSYIVHDGHINPYSTLDDKRKVNSGFATDAWLANWDAVCSSNTVQKNNDAVRLDFGGTLDFRARGGRKYDFGGKVDELKTLLDTHINPEAASVYATLTKDDLIQSMQKVVDIKNEDIQNLTSKYKLTQYTDVLINRKNYINRVLQKALITPQNEKETIFEYISRLTCS